GVPHAHRRPHRRVSGHRRAGHLDRHRDGRRRALVFDGGDAMKRRDFLFGSMKAAALLSPVLSVRRAEAQLLTTPKRLFVWVSSAGYPDEGAFFTDGQEDNWQLGEILANCGDVKENMIVLDGIDIRDSGYNAAGANHARAPGKVVTAKDVID